MEESKNRYMDLLNIEKEEDVFKEIKKLTSELSDNEHIIRSCIMEMHAAVEIELKRILYHTFYSHLFLTNNEEKNEKVEKGFNNMIDGLGFSGMWRILKPVMIPWYVDFESIDKINEARNQAAHGEISKVRYKGRNPFEIPDCLAQMFFEVWAIKQQAGKYFGWVIERPKAQLKRYVSKYGEGEL